MKRSNNLYTFLSNYAHSCVLTYLKTTTVLIQTTSSDKHEATFIIFFVRMASECQCCKTNDIYKNRSSLTIFPCGDSALSPNSTKLP